MAKNDAEILGESVARLFDSHAEGSLFIGRYKIDEDSSEPTYVYSSWFVGKDGQRINSERVKITNALTALVGEEKCRRCFVCKVTKPNECFSSNSYRCKICQSIDLKKRYRKKR